MKRGEIRWANLEPPIGRRPVVVVSRSGALEHRSRVTVVPITRSHREIASQVGVGPSEGLQDESAIGCDNIMTIPQEDLDPASVGRLGEAKTRELDRALRFALEIRY